MQRRLRWGLAAASIGILVSALAIPMPSTAGKFSQLFSRRTTVERLARQIDRLEYHIETYGSIVAKQPDIWGEARLTKHRGEYEEILFNEKDAFDVTINASISRSDQAFLANAMSISAAISGPQAHIQTNNPLAPTTVTNVSTPAPPTTPAALVPSRQNEEVTTLIYGVKDQISLNNVETFLTPPSPSSPPKSSPPPTPPPATIDPPSLTDPQSMIIEQRLSRSDTRFPNSLTFGYAGNAGIALEPTLMLDQLSRYVNHLHELRRINEGDDTSDAPGYALNLVRVPISILPGKCTQKGYGAEVTMTMSYYPSDDLLPRTFRSLVINDLVDQLALPILQMSEVAKQIRLLAETIANLEATIAHETNEQARISNEINQLNKSNFADNQPLREPATIAKKVEVLNERLVESIHLQQEAQDAIPPIRQRIEQIKRQIDTLRASVLPMGNSTSKRRGSRFSVSGSAVPDVFGKQELLRIGEVLESVYQKTDKARHGEALHLFDVQNFLKEELESSYSMLLRTSKSKGYDAWASICSELPDIIHLPYELECTRDRFYTEIAKSAELERSSISAALAWAILIESSLLNDRFYEDMARVAADKGCACNLDVPAPLYGPYPSDLAKQNFADYVQCRWPIHVFSLDPVEQNQNVADSFSLRREMQLALALAFTSGQIDASNFTRYMRRIEMEVETIALNKTAVGFAHGHDTFGWRFYPRVQTPPIKSHIATLAQDFLIGGANKNQLIRHHCLEPGQRECMALVIMPSFVPYVTVDIRSNWFKLTNPRVKQFDLEDTVELSRDVQDLYSLREACIRDEHLYRDGEVMRLSRAVDQLETRLSLQTEVLEMPYENTLGGYALFSSGLTTLGPELIGYYGEPGVSQEHETTLFLVGNHFSVHDTRVVAAGHAVQADLISRQVMQVKIPAVKNLIGEKDDLFIDVHVATPYGVSEHLHIPALPKKEDEAKKAAAKALEDHVKDQHPVSVVWKGSDAAKARIGYAIDSYKITEFDIARPELVKVKIEKKGEAPPDLFVFPRSTKLAMFVKLVSKKDGKVFKKIPIGRWQLDVSTDGQPVEFNMSNLMNVNDRNLSMAEEIQAKVKGEPAPDGLKEVVLEAFIRFDADGLPVIRVGDVLKIELTETSRPFNEGFPISPTPVAPPPADGTAPSAPANGAAEDGTKPVSDADLLLPPIDQNAGELRNFGDERFRTADSAETEDAFAPDNASDEIGNFDDGKSTLSGTLRARGPLMRRR